jgi:hypothetical protein
MAREGTPVIERSRADRPTNTRFTATSPRKADASAPYHQGVDNLVALEVLPKQQHRHIAAPLHRELLRLIGSNGLATPTGVVFIKKNINSEVRVYKVESISLGENGVIDMEAVHHPVDSSGVSLLGKNWTTYATDGNWVIKTN